MPIHKNGFALLGHVVRLLQWQQDGFLLRCTATSPSDVVVHPYCSWRPYCSCTSLLLWRKENRNRIGIGSNANLWHIMIATLQYENPKIENQNQTHTQRAYVLYAITQYGWRTKRIIVSAASILRNQCYRGQQTRCSTHATSAETRNLRQHIAVWPWQSESQSQSKGNICNASTTRWTICRTDTSWRVADKELWDSRKTEHQFASRKQWCIGIGMTQRKQQSNNHWFECQSVTHHDSNFEMRTLHNWESKSEATPRCIHNISKHKMNRPSDDYEWFMSCNRSWRRLRTHKSTWRNITK